MINLYIVFCEEYYKYQYQYHLVVYKLFEIFREPIFQSILFASKFLMIMRILKTHSRRSKFSWETLRRLSESRTMRPHHFGEIILTIKMLYAFSRKIVPVFRNWNINRLEWSRYVAIKLNYFKKISSGKNAFWGFAWSSKIWTDLVNCVFWQYLRSTSFKLLTKEIVI